MIEPTDAAWLAGLCDGEGCFTASIKAGEKRIQPAFYLGMSDGPWVERVVKIIRDDLGVPCHVKYKPKKRVVSVCIGSKRGVQTLCTALQPYSIVKRGIIDAMLAYKGFPRVNQHCYYVEDYIAAIIAAADFIDYIRMFNRKRNIPYYWTGDRIMEMHGLDPSIRKSRTAPSIENGAISKC